MQGQLALRRIADNCRSLASTARDELARDDLLAMASDYEEHAFMLERWASENLQPDTAVTRIPR